ncbi:MAG: hypothetical protein HRT69_09395 [Flavobacteriaceae bacterium]|nr:hypothetical protein [Flavobacteriaceae bacterium]
MRKIKIDAVLMNKAKVFRDSLFVREGVVMGKPKDRLEKLKGRLGKIKHKKHIKYLQLLIDNYDEIQIATPKEMVKWIKDFEDVLHVGEISEKAKNKKKKFWEEIVQALRYNDLQKIEYPNYLRKENIKTCVYCNAQSCLVVQPQYYDSKKKSKIKITRPRFEIDHYYPKSKYPYFGTSFFNLYPSCSSCNNVKRESKALFELYTEDDDLEVFNFRIDDLDLIDKHLKLNKRNKNIKVFLEPIDMDFRLLNNHNKLFSVQAIIDENADIVEELFLKSKLYSTAYKNSLVSGLGKIFNDTSIIDRLIIGNYSKPEDIHKRPMAKFTQDIARQLNLIK